MLDARTTNCIWIGDLIGFLDHSIGKIRASIDGSKCVAMEKFSLHTRPIADANRKPFTKQLFSDTNFKDRILNVSQQHGESLPTNQKPKAPSYFKGSLLPVKQILNSHIFPIAIQCSNVDPFCHTTQII